MYDKNGKLFDPAEYASYSTTSSYIDYSVNRVNDPEKGMSLEFPYTPWPVGLTYSYIIPTDMQQTGLTGYPVGPVCLFYHAERLFPVCLSECCKTFYENEPEFY